MPSSHRDTSVRQGREKATPKRRLPPILANRRVVHKWARWYKRKGAGSLRSSCASFRQRRPTPLISFHTTPRRRVHTVGSCQGSRRGRSSQVLASASSDELPVRRIPLQLAVVPVGQVAQVADGDRAGADLDVGDRPLARADAVDPVAVMARRLEQVDVLLAQRLLDDALGLAGQLAAVGERDLAVGPVERRSRRARRGSSRRRWRRCTSRPVSPWGLPAG